MGDSHRIERAFQVGDLVFLKVRPYRQTSVVSRANQKLAAKFFGPFPVEKKIGAIAYRFKLPIRSVIHPVFHVSLLKRARVNTDLQVQPNLPAVDDKGAMKLEPATILARRVVA
ncbi:unnamed protein product [Linum trigynum]|uniref:Tf2-1-like SH3-like domain-containing protein n=1 Tax=Linum trigynum TaxID=586398 RepID=A0AAV2GT79_9ROSI